MTVVMREFAFVRILMVKYVGLIHLTEAISIIKMQQKISILEDIVKLLTEGGEMMRNEFIHGRKAGFQCCFWTMAVAYYGSEEE